MNVCTVAACVFQFVMCIRKNAVAIKLSITCIPVPAEQCAARAPQRLSTNQNRAVLIPEREYLYGFPFWQVHKIPDHFAFWHQFSYFFHCFCTKNGILTAQELHSADLASFGRRPPRRQPISVFIQKMLPTALEYLLRARWNPTSCWVRLSGCNIGGKPFKQNKIDKYSRRIAVLWSCKRVWRLQTESIYSC